MDFFVSRHVSESSPDHVVSLASRCLESIREFHPDSRVTFVEDRVDPKMSFSSLDDRVRVVSNPFPGSGELGTIYVASKSESDSKMVIMHDSMVVLRPINEMPGPIGVRSLWEFRRYHFHHLPQVLLLLSVMAQSCRESSVHFIELLSLYTRPEGAWTGCFTPAT